MRAIQVGKTGGPEVLELVDLPKPEPKAGEVLVKVEAAGEGSGGDQPGGCSGGDVAGADCALFSA